MKKLFFVAVAAIAVLGVSCENTFVPGKLEDKPFVEFFEESMTVGAEGGEVIIPVTSTGVDNVEIIFDYSDRWEVNEENGDLTPQEGWIKIVKVINEYEVPTRALAKWDSGICIMVEPNTTGYERKAKISVQSFMLHDTIEIIQSAGEAAE
ncbi:MAG: BACON domain-containing protein [Alistipes sp.]|nr:BACON domain-containing protein [Alistipes sp.]